MRLSPQLKRDYHEVWGTDAGRRVLLDILKSAGMGRSTVVPGDAVATYGNACTQRVGLHVASVLALSDMEVYELTRPEVRTQESTHVGS